jgi:acyl-CoA reductase-like NAD-dependent aldehyde dehydrogenase
MSATTTVAGIAVSPDHWIGGERVSSAETFADISPIDESHLADIARGTAIEAEQAIDAANAAFPGGARRAPLPHRRADRGA